MEHASNDLVTHRLCSALLHPPGIAPTRGPVHSAKPMSVATRPRVRGACTLRFIVGGVVVAALEHWLGRAPSVIGVDRLLGGIVGAAAAQRITTGRVGDRLWGSCVLDAVALVVVATAAAGGPVFLHEISRLFPTSEC